MTRRPARSSWLGRALLGAAAIAFAYLGYVYLSLPDVRPLSTRSQHFAQNNAINAFSAAFEVTDGRLRVAQAGKFDAL